MSEELGLNAKRENDFSKWYLEVVRKGGFIDQRSPIKGFDVIMPWGYSVWEFIQNEFDKIIKKHGVRNAYFPSLIPERLIKKEEKHLSGFKAEVLAVTETGDSKLEERLFMRPTSETIMYAMYSLWIRSHKDLPFKINQWCNIVRWDTKVTRPFIRGREFLWQEGHTAHTTKEDADNWLKSVVEFYKTIYDALAMDPLILVRPKSDTFPGADYSIVFDTLTQDGKVGQGPGSHMLGQNFSKPFDITYIDEKGKKNHVWQTSWGMTTRQIGLLIMHHGDDKGAVLPPAVSPIQVAIIPILFKGKEKPVLKQCNIIRDSLIKKGIRVYLDDREYSAGFKFNEWELKGVPLRIEIGPKDEKAKEMTVVSRIDGDKQKVKITKISNITNLLDTIQQSLIEKSKKFLKRNIKDIKKIEDIHAYGLSRANW
ncbi:proline--tRNA ligase, partial [Candidatus Aenigmatarchaeota archaeon]